MPRGFKVDSTRTQLAHEGMDSLFPSVMADSRSFISLPKATTHTNGVAQPHLILYGKDKGIIRKVIFHLNRLMNGRNQCWKCGRSVSEDIVGFSTLGHWHHLSSKPSERCDCADNGIVLCWDCHEAEHANRKPWAVLEVSE